MNTTEKVAVCSRSFSKNSVLRADLLEKYKNVYNDIIVSKKLSDRKYKQLQGLEKISVIQTKYKTVKRKIARNKRDLENLKLLVVSIY